MKTDDIRRLYLDFFRSKGHELVASDSLVPKDDPTLLFTGAGMNQFKEQFLGRNVTYRRATTCQKCVRTGDLGNVGRTPRHHTFFEMLGNFSFGDYFKKEAILWAWEFFTQQMKIPETRLWASVYKDDDEAYAIWRDIVHLPEKRIIRLGEKDNFWPAEAPSKGPNGPCGPCSEIFYDYGADVGCGRPDCTPACDCARFVEVWNLVFTQFDRQSDGTLKPLPNKNIDTGMGLERLASVMQGVKNNFEIDTLKVITAAIERSRESRAGEAERDRKAKVNAIADHIRAVTFMIADGVMPSNEERGYVARKLVRRSLAYGVDLGISAPFLYRLVATVVDVMKAHYPELVERRDDIAQIIEQEEKAFLFVLHNQLPKVDEAFTAMAAAKADAGKIAAAAFNFYDTYGMPYDMLEEMAEKHAMAIDKARFDALLNKQREQSRAGTKLKGEIFTETFAKKVEALGLETSFLGYEQARSDATVVAVMDGGEVILDKTPFYGESGGQVGDWGTITTPSGEMAVEDAKKIGRTIVHIGRMLKGHIAKGERAHVVIDEVVRRKTAANHTATHLLQAALRQVLGPHVKQTGSFVDSERLRFDFTHMKKLEERELERVEAIVNQAVSRALPVAKETKTLDEARADGATALFGEKYDKTVRVVTIADLSKELCGGTHIDNTRDIRLFKVMSESSIASGVRRIEAVTGDAATAWLEKKKAEADAARRAEEEKARQKEALAVRVHDEIAALDAVIAAAPRPAGRAIVVKHFDRIAPDGLRALSDGIRAKDSAAVILLATHDGEKVSFTISVPDDLVKKGITAGEFAKAFAGMIDGSGGGKPGFAQGGGKSPAKLGEALTKIVTVMTTRVG